MLLKVKYMKNKAIYYVIILMFLEFDLTKREHALNIFLGKILACSLLFDTVNLLIFIDSSFFSISHEKKNQDCQI